MVLSVQEGGFSSFKLLCKSMKHHRCKNERLISVLVAKICHPEQLKEPLSAHSLHMSLVCDFLKDFISSRSLTEHTS